MAQLAVKPLVNQCCKPNDIFYCFDDGQVRYFKVIKMCSTKHQEVFIAEIEIKKIYHDKQEGVAYPVPDCVIGSEEVVKIKTIPTYYGTDNQSGWLLYLDDNVDRYFCYFAQKPPVFTDS